MNLPWNNDPRVFGIYVISIILCILSVLSFFGTPIIGLIIGIATIVTAACGAFGAWRKSPKFLWMFMLGLGGLALLAIIGIIIAVIKDSGSISLGLIIDILLILVYGTGAALAWHLRGKSLKPSNSFQKLETSNKPTAGGETAV
eukprot:TRINITY_DN5770_c0_g1_i2.p1 TRINITY_DN5770_c0_g1~~TRINITY_DN5770_c0_g1_i2.p1  ORF type:complete len:144 (-),score=26.52 TRINITY_DN5770_c0_g1_i2:66-497(-)